MSINLKKSKYFLIFRDSFIGWWSRDALSQSAAAAYCAIFSLPGFLMVIMAISILAFERQQVENQIVDYIRKFLGTDSANILHDVINNAQTYNPNSLPMTVGIITLLFGATGLFVQLQKSLNAVWEVKVKTSVGLMLFLKDRATALGITISLGFLFMISLMLTAILTVISEWLSRQFSDSFVYFFFGLNFIVSLITITFLFTLIYKILPDVHLHWHDALRGGALASSLFIIGEYALAIYFKIFQPASTFGAAGSIILFLIWIYYSCLVLFFGAEFIRSYMLYMKNTRPKPTAIAKRVAF